MNYIFTIILALIALTPTHVQAEGNVSRFTLFYSNDMHGETEPCG